MSKSKKSEMPVDAATTCSACGGSGVGPAMYRPEIDKTQRDRCYTCQGSGKTRSEHDRSWEKNFVVPIGREMKKRGIAYMVMVLRDDGKLAYVLEPAPPDDATANALIRLPNAPAVATAPKDSD